MALSNQQVRKIHLYLGYPFRGGSTPGDVDQLIIAAGEDEDDQLEIEEALAGLALVKTAIIQGLSSAGLKGVDKKDVEYQDQKGDHPTLAYWFRVGNMFIGQLSIATSVPIYGAYFGSLGLKGEIAQSNPPYQFP